MAADVRLNSLRGQIVGATLLGVAIRVLLPLLVVDYSHESGDGAYYDRIASNLAQHGTFSTDLEPPFTASATRPPLVPLVAAVSYRLFGHSLLPVHLFFGLLGLLTALVVAAVVQRVEPRATLPALWLGMASPFNALYEGRLLAEAMTAFLLAVGLALPLLWRDWKAWALGGVCLGWAALARDVCLPLAFGAVAAALVFGFLRRGAPRWWPVLMLAGIVAGVAPWTARNCLDTPTCTAICRGYMGYNLWLGTWERDGNWLQPDGPHYPDYAFDEPSQRAQVEGRDMSEDALFRGLALAHIRSHPLATLVRWIARAPRMWIGTRTDQFTLRSAWAPRTRPWVLLKVAFFAMNLALLGLGTVGLILAWRERSSMLLFAVPVLVTIAVYLPFHDTETRYSEPVLPLLIGFVALVVARRTACAQALRLVLGRLNPLG
jgi:Dolichyl-phosphate-mannose-protein mannosyltransferase